jgi:hypothetical protein
LNIRHITFLTVFILIAINVLPVVASPPGVVISQQVSQANYKHYLEDLLYTFLGDNRGFGPEHDLARTNIHDTLQSFGLTVTLEPFVYQTVTYYNVVAVQPGTDNTAETIVVGAHYDSVNNPGADDNGTGTALVMEIARVLSQHRASRNIHYVLFDREEQGRRGSIAYATAHIVPDNIVWAVTADMVGHDSGAYGMDLYSKSTSSTVTNGVASSIGTYGNGLNAFLNFGNYSFSDHWSFEVRNIPAVVIIERCYTCNTHYHQPTDAVDQSPTYISYAMCADLVRSVTGYLVDNVPVALWHDKDNDADVDDADLAEFRLCFGQPAAPACLAFDKNRDAVVDCNDWPSFRDAYSASQGHPPVIDVDSFVGVLLGTNPTPADLCLSDVNSDTLHDGRDVQSYVQEAITP